MNSQWNDTLAGNGASINAGTVTGFGDPGGELVAARDAAVICPLTHLSAIRVSGEDARDFLHNQLTSDINHLAGDDAQHSAWCSAKGRMVASFIVWRDGDDYRLLVATDLVETIAKRLQMYVLRARVKVVVDSDCAIVGAAGERTAEILGVLDAPRPATMKTSACRGGQAIGLDGSRALVVLDAATASATWPRLCEHARPAGVPVWQWLDIRAGLPLVTAATREHFVPQMANFERIGGVSFHKGCYPGQEIVARTQYLGKVKRHLYRLHGESEMTAGTELFSAAAQDQSCGMIVVGAPAPMGGFDALAVLMENAVEAGIALGQRNGPAVTAVPVAA